MSRHKLIAIFIAPFLAVGGYIAAGFFTEPTTPMRALVMEQECRPAVEDCVLQTQGLTLRLSTDNILQAGETVEVEVTSSSAVDDVYVSFAGKKQQSEPYRLTEKEENSWQGKVLVNNNVDVKKARLRLVISWQGHVYFADEKIKQ